MDLNIAERIFDANVRVAGMWPFPFGEAPGELLEAFEYDEALPDGLNDLVKSWDDEERSQLFDGDDAAREAWNELSAAGFRKRLTGWIVRVECPVFQKHGENGCSFSWGYLQMENLFAPTAEKALEAACEWAEQNYAVAMGDAA